MSTKVQVEWRRAKVLELLSKGYSQSEIAKTLQVDLSVISRDVYFLRQQTKSNIKRYIDERLPEEYEKMSCWVKCNYKRSMEYSSEYRRQKRKDTGIIFSKRLLFNEAGFAY